MSYSSLVSYYRLTNNRGSREGYKIRGFAIHCFVGQVTAKQGVDYFATTDRDASSNYVIGFDGSIGCSVDDEYRSWCTSNGIDKQIITIEMACEPYHPYEVTPVAYKALIRLLADRCKAYGIKKLVWKEDKAAALNWDLSDQNMVVHRWFDAKACPGDFLYSRHYAIADAVNALLAGAEPDPSPNIPDPAPVPSPEPDRDYESVQMPTLGYGDEGGDVASLQGAIQSKGYDLRYCGGTDGIFGEGTEYAVKAFQREHGLEDDGVVGPLTWGKLFTI